MKYIKKLLLMLIIVFSISFVKAEECDSSNITIKSIEIENVIGHVDEIEEASFNDKNIDINIQMSSPGDSIEYKIVLENNSSNDYYFDGRNIDINKEFFNYEYSYEDDSNLIKANDVKTVELKITYSKQIPASATTNNNYFESNIININMIDSSSTFNPVTGNNINYYVIGLGLILLVTTLLLQRRKKYKIMIVLLLAFIPIYVYATCSCNISIETNIKVDTKKTIFLPGEELNIKMKNLAGDDTSENGILTMNYSITAIKHSAEEPSDLNKQEENIVSTEESTYPIYMWFEDGTIYWWSEIKYPLLNSDSKRAFGYLFSLNDIKGLEDVDTSIVTSFYSTFLANTSLKNVGSLSRWNTSSATTMHTMFSNHYSNTQDDVVVGIEDISGLRNWDTSKVTDMAGMFQFDAFTDLEPLRNWDTSNVEIMNHMFNRVRGITTTEPIANWDVRKVTTMRQMFASCTSLSIVDLSGWQTDSLVETINMFGVWYGATPGSFSNNFGAEKTFILSNKFNTSKVTNFDTMFANNEISDYSFLQYFDTSSAKSMENMFAYNKITNLSYLSAWDVSNVESMKKMFVGTAGLTDASGINDWDISSVTDFTEMFKQSRTHPEFTKVNGTWDSSGTFIPD